MDFFIKKNIKKYFFFIKKYYGIFFLTHPPLPDFWKKSSGEACYARGGEIWRISGVRRSVNATRKE